MHSPSLNSVFQGDALEVMQEWPSEWVDITVTSPPYNKRNKAQGWLVKNSTYGDFDDHSPEDEYQQKQISVLNELFRITRPGGSAFYNHKLRWNDGQLIHPIQWLAKSKWTIRQEIVWDRGIAANMRGWRFWQVDERLYWLYKPVDGKLVGRELESKHAKMSSIWRLKPAPRMDSHPAPFPLALPMRAVYSVAHTSPAVVLDPYCGTGTTLVAAALLQHNYIGIDLSLEYVQLTRDRLASREEEAGKAKEEVDRHFIEDPFKDRKSRGTVNWPFGPKNDIK